jgi:hypothetical protein
MLQRLAEIGMQLAERAAAEALQEPADDARKQKRPDPTLLFIRLSAMVRACINQQTRLAAGKMPPAPRPRSQTPPDTTEATKPNPERTEIQRAVEPMINAYLEIDSELRHPGGTAILEVCQAFGIPPTRPAPSK